MYRIESSLLAVALFVISCSHCKEVTEIEALASKPTRCTYEYAYDMYGAHCAGLRLSKIPNLRGGIEILDFSENKLQEIHSDTLSGYSSIKFLYLADNQIYSIDEDGLTSLTSLQSLDLSNNVILELPASLFQLPSLRKLYLHGNPLIHMRLNNLQLSKPIAAPLELLDISDCKIKQLPDWGCLPQLILYNISNNPLTSLDPQHFALMSNLEKVDLTKSLENLKTCDLKPAITWFQEKHVYFQLDYSKLNSKAYDQCTLPADVIPALNATSQRCENIRINGSSPSRRTWLMITGGLAGFLIGFILLLYLMHRHNVAQTKTTAEKIKEATPQNDGDRHATARLITHM